MAGSGSGPVRGVLASSSYTPVVSLLFLGQRQWGQDWKQYEQGYNGKDKILQDRIQHNALLHCVRYYCCGYESWSSDKAGQGHAIRLFSICVIFVGFLVWFFWLLVVVVFRFHYWIWRKLPCAWWHWWELITISACIINLLLSSGISDGISFLKEAHRNALCCYLKRQPASTLKQEEGWSSQASDCSFLLLQGKADRAQKPEQAPHGCCCCPGPPCFCVIPHLCRPFSSALRKSAQKAVRHCFPLPASRNFSIYYCA